MTPAQNPAPPRRLRRRFVVAALVGVALGLAGPAYGYWTATSTGSHAAADAATLPTPDLTATSLTATSAKLSWTRPFAATGYDLAQSPGSLTGCAAHPATSTTDCTASGLTPNTSYTWSLSAAMHNWRSPATVTATTPKQATTATISSTTPQSGRAGTSFTATAKVTGNAGYGTPAGTLTFRLYPTSNCSGPASYTTPAQTTTGGSATGSLQPAAAGTYRWRATYTPTDNYNKPSTSTCSDPITVTQAGGTYFATGPPTTVAHDSQGVVVQYPAGTTQGDLVLLVLADTENHPSTIVSTGWSDIDHSTDNSHMGLQSWWHTAGTETSVTIGHEHISGTGQGATAWVLTYKNMANPTLVSHSSGITTSGSTGTPPNLTTTAANATVISLVGTNQAEELSLSTARDFDFRISQSVASPPHALGVADRFVPTAGTITPPTWQGPTPSQWAYTTVAFTSSP